MPVALGFALFTIGAPLALVNFVAIGFGATLVNLAIGVALSAAASALLFRPPQLGQSPSIKPSDGQQAIRQAVPPRLKSYGLVRIGGPVWWYDTDVATGELYIGQALNHGRIEGVDQYWIDDNPVTRNSGTGAIETAPYSTLPINIAIRLGAPTESKYTAINSIFGIDEVRGDGLASFLAIVPSPVDPADYLEIFPGNAPTITALIRPVAFDPRDVGQANDDPSTWEFSENPVVCFLTYLIDPEGFGIPWSKIEPNIDEWKAEADICDEEIASISGGGTEALYRVACTYAMTERPADIAARFMRACDGRFWQRRDGTIGISVGRYREPTVHITDDHISSVDLTRGQDRLTRVAGVRAQFMSPQHLYREQDAEAWPTGDIVQDVADDRLANIDLTWVPSHSQARRLMKRLFLREVAMWHGTVQTNLAGLRAIDERFINLTISELGIEADSFEITQFNLDLATMTCTLQVRMIGAEIDEWEASLEEGVAPTVPSGPISISRLTGTPIGSLTANGGLAAAFDGISDQNSSASARSTGDVSSGYIGKTFASPKAFAKAIVYGSNNGGFWQGNPSTTIRIRGKNGAAPSGPTDGTIIGSVSFVDTTDESDGRQIISTDTATAYTHIFAEVSRSGVSALIVAELLLWEET